MMMKWLILRDSGFVQQAGQVRREKAPRALPKSLGEINQRKRGSENGDIY